MPADLALPAELSGEAPEFGDALVDAINSGSWAAVPAEAAEYVPATIGEAEWSARHLADLEQQEAEVEQQAAVWQAQIDGWKEDKLRRLRTGLDLFRRQLEAYALRERELNPKQKTTRLPSAEISTRQEHEAKVVLDDEEAVIAWAQETLSGDEYDRVIKTVEKVLISELRKLVKAGPSGKALTIEDGEVVPGLKVIAPSTTATVKTLFTHKP